MSEQEEINEDAKTDFTIPEQVQFKRKKKLILPKLQLTLIMAALLVFIAASVVFFATLQIVFLKLNQIALQAGLVEGSNFFLELKGLENVTASVYGITILISIIFIFVGGIRLSHKVAGPIYYLNRHINRVTDGETLEGVTFRKGDFLLDLCDSFNKLMEQHRELADKKKEAK